MNGALLDTRRRHLGLSIAEIATLVGVEERTVNRWHNDRSRMRPDVAAILNELENKMERMVSEAVAEATDRMGDGCIELYRYRTADDLDIPLGAHAMMTAWTLDALSAEGFDVSIEWVDDDKLE